MAAETYTIEGLQQWAEQTGRNMENADFRQPLTVCKYLISNAVKDNFEGAHDPDGVPWAPLKTPRKNNKKHPLWDTGRLVASTGAGEGHVEQMTRDTLIYGTNVIYAAIHNYGGEINMPAKVAPTSKGKPYWSWINADGKRVFAKKIKAFTLTIPQRRFLGIGPKLAADIQKVFEKWMLEQMAADIGLRMQGGL